MCECRSVPFCLLGECLSCRAIGAPPRMCTRVQAMVLLVFSVVAMVACTYEAISNIVHSQPTPVWCEGGCISPQHLAHVAQPNACVEGNAVPSSQVVARVCGRVNEVLSGRQPLGGNGAAGPASVDRRDVSSVRERSSAASWLWESGRVESTSAW